MLPGDASSFSSRILYGGDKLRIATKNGSIRIMSESYASVRS